MARVARELVKLSSICSLVLVSVRVLHLLRLWVDKSVVDECVNVVLPVLLKCRPSTGDSNF